MDYNNNICIIGKDINSIKNKLNLIQDKDPNKLENLWNIISYEINDNNNNDYKLLPENEDKLFDNMLDNIEKIKKDSMYDNKIFSFTIIHYLDEFESQKKNLEKMFEKIIVKFKNDFYYQPFIIILVNNEPDKQKIEKFLNNKNLFEGIDKRKISNFIKKDSSNIIKKIYKIFSYFFGLGDKFEINNKEYKLFSPIKDLNPINILVLGKEQNGKSTFINSLLMEKRAKEGNGSKETKDFKTYHLDGIPLLINDIEGFNGEKTINQVVNKIEKMQKNLLEQEIHLVIYIISYESPSFFSDNEYLIFKQLVKYLHDTQFLFVCTKAKKNDEDKKIEKIQGGFFKMIKNEFDKNKKESKNIINVLNYLYYAVKKDIFYDEIPIENRNNIRKEEFKTLSFFEKLELKFQNNVDKNKEMTETIIKKDETLLFVNLIEDNNHEIEFGMDLVSKKIRKALNYLKESSIKFIDSNKKYNEEEIKRLTKEIEILKENINEKDSINEPEIETLNQHDRKSLSAFSINLNNREEMIKNIDELIKNLREKNVNEAKKSAEKLKKKYFELAKEEVKYYNVKSFFAGLLPLFDILFQYIFKKNAKEKIAYSFGDDLIDFEQSNINLSTKEKKYLEKVKEQTSDKFGDISKSALRVVTIGIDVFGKLLLPFTIIGTLFGMYIGKKQMDEDISALLEFYGKRLIYRYLINLSFDSIEKYLIDNFENKK